MRAIVPILLFLAIFGTKICQTQAGEDEENVQLLSSSNKRQLTQNFIKHFKLHDDPSSKNTENLSSKEAKKSINDVADSSERPNEDQQALSHPSIKEQTSKESQAPLSSNQKSQERDGGKKSESTKKNLSNTAPGARNPRKVKESRQTQDNEQYFFDDDPEEPPSIEQTREKKSLKPSSGTRIAVLVSPESITSILGQKSFKSKDIDSKFKALLSSNIQKNIEPPKNQAKQTPKNNFQQTFRDNLKTTLAFRQNPQAGKTQNVKQNSPIIENRPNVVRFELENKRLNQRIPEFSNGGTSRPLANMGQHLLQNFQKESNFKNVKNLQKKVTNKLPELPINQVYNLQPELHKFNQAHSGIPIQQKKFKQTQFQSAPDIHEATLPIHRPNQRPLNLKQQFENTHRREPQKESQRTNSAKDFNIRLHDRNPSSTSFGSKSNSRNQARLTSRPKDSFNPFRSLPRFEPQTSARREHSLQDYVIPPSVINSKLSDLKPPQGKTREKPNKSTRNRDRDRNRPPQSFGSIRESLPKKDKQDLDGKRESFFNFLKEHSLPLEDTFKRNKNDRNSPLSPPPPPSNQPTFASFDRNNKQRQTFESFIRNNKNDNFPNNEDIFKIFAENNRQNIESSTKFGPPKLNDVLDRMKEDPIFFENFAKAFFGGELKSKPRESSKSKPIDKPRKQASKSDGQLSLLDTLINLDNPKHFNQGANKDTNRENHRAVQNHKDDEQENLFGTFLTQRRPKIGGKSLAQILRKGKDSSPPSRQDSFRSVNREKPVHLRNQNNDKQEFQLKSSFHGFNIFAKGSERNKNQNHNSLRTKNENTSSTFKSPKSFTPAPDKQPIAKPQTENVRDNTHKNGGKSVSNVVKEPKPGFLDIFGKNILENGNQADPLTFIDQHGISIPLTHHRSPVFINSTVYVSATPHTPFFSPGDLVPRIRNPNFLHSTSFNPQPQDHTNTPSPRLISTNAIPPGLPNPHINRRPLPHRRNPNRLRKHKRPIPKHPGNLVPDIPIAKNPIHPGAPVLIENRDKQVFNPANPPQVIKDDINGIKSFSFISRPLTNQFGQNDLGFIPTPVPNFDPQKIPQHNVFPHIDHSLINFKHPENPPVIITHTETRQRTPTRPTESPIIKKHAVPITPPDEHIISDPHITQFLSSPINSKQLLQSNPEIKNLFFTNTLPKNTAGFPGPFSFISTNAGHINLNPGLEDKIVNIGQTATNSIKNNPVSHFVVNSNQHQNAIHNSNTGKSLIANSIHTNANNFPSLILHSNQNLGNQNNIPQFVIPTSNTGSNGQNFVVLKNPINLQTHHGLSGLPNVARIPSSTPSSIPLQHPPQNSKNLQPIFNIRTVTPLTTEFEQAVPNSLSSIKEHKLNFQGNSNPISTNPFNISKIPRTQTPKPNTIINNANKHLRANAFQVHHITTPSSVETKIHSQPQVKQPGRRKVLRRKRIRGGRRPHKLKGQQNHRVSTLTDVPVPHNEASNIPRLPTAPPDFNPIRNPNRFPKVKDTSNRGEVLHSGRPKPVDIIQNSNNREKSFAGKKESASLSLRNTTPEPNFIRKPPNHFNTIQVATPFPQQNNKIPLTHNHHRHAPFPQQNNKIPLTHNHHRHPPAHPIGSFQVGPPNRQPLNLDKRNQVEKKLGGNAFKINNPIPSDRFTIGPPRPFPPFGNDHSIFQQDKRPPGALNTGLPLHQLPPSGLSPIPPAHRAPFPPFNSFNSPLPGFKPPPLPFVTTISPFGGNPHNNRFDQINKPLIEIDNDSSGLKRESGVKNLEDKGTPFKKKEQVFATTFRPFQPFKNVKNFSEGTTPREPFRFSHQSRPIKGLVKNEKDEPNLVRKDVNSLKTPKHTVSNSHAKARIKELKEKGPTLIKNVSSGKGNSQVDLSREEFGKVTKPRKLKRRKRPRKPKTTSAQPGENEKPSLPPAQITSYFKTPGSKDFPTIDPEFDNRPPVHHEPPLPVGIPHSSYPFIPPYHPFYSGPPPVLFRGGVPPPHLVSNFHLGSPAVENEGIHPLHHSFPHGGFPPFFPEGVPHGDFHDGAAAPGAPTLVVHNNFRS